MITKRRLKKEKERIENQLDRLEERYCNFAIGDKEYEERRPILIGRLMEVNDLLCGITNVEKK